MESREGTISSSGITVVGLGSDAPSDYHVAPRTTDNPIQVTGSAPLPQPAVSDAGVFGATIEKKKKRGRPRKYTPDGSATKPLTPKPISSSAPAPMIDFSAAEKGGKLRPAQHPITESEILGNSVIAI